MTIRLWKTLTLALVVAVFPALAARRDAPARRGDLEDRVVRRIKPES